MGWFCPLCGLDADAAGTCANDGAAHEPVSTHDLIGHVLGDHKIVEVIGGGAFGRVYRAIHVRSGLVVAIKLVHRPIAERGSHGRVLTEARAAVSTDHPNAVRVYDLGLTSDGRPYIVMELLHGAPLAALCPLPVEIAVAYAQQVLGALGAAHARGVIHRDLKPDNIFITDQRATVVDFGLAKLTGGGPLGDLTATNDTIGTPAYMAPEQIAGAERVAQGIDGRADLYSLGCVLFEMIAGRPPFVGSTYQLLVAHRDSEAPAITTLCPQVPHHVATAIARALAKRPDDRFATAHDMARALAGVPVRTSRRLHVAILVAAALGGIAAIAWAVGGDAPGSTRRTMVVPPPSPNEPSDARLDGVLRSLADSFNHGVLDESHLVRMRCDYLASQRAETAHTPATLRAFTRRVLAMIDDVAPDLSRDCVSGQAQSPRIAMPPALAHEPALERSWIDALESTHRALDDGSYTQVGARATLCSLRMAGTPANQAAARAFYRRLSALFLAYFPELATTKC